jgi:electron-transferring-flavoprotein dehydrogenase
MRNKVDMIIVGAGIAGLSAALTAKTLCPEKTVCVVDKADGPGKHNLSGASFEPESIYDLLNLTYPLWRENKRITAFLGRRVEKESFYILTSPAKSLNITGPVQLAAWLKCPTGEMVSRGDVIISISKLVRVLEAIAVEKGVELLYNFPVCSVEYDSSGRPVGVRLADKGLAKDGSHLENYARGELVLASHIVIAEGTDGFVAEQFIEYSELERDCNQLYSIGLKEILEVSQEQYSLLGDNGVVRLAGYPIWKPFSAPSIFGGGVLYPMGDNHIAVVLITSLDWKYKNFNPFEAFCLFKRHPVVAKFINGGRVVQSGAKMIPEAGYYAVPRNKVNDAMASTGNVVLVGDCAGFVNVRKMKGVSNSIYSGILAGKAFHESADNPDKYAACYSAMLKKADFIKELKKAGKFRQLVSTVGVTLGMPLANIDFILPLFHPHPDSSCEMRQSYRYSGAPLDDQSLFIKNTGVHYREDQPPHLIIKDIDVCKWDCARRYDCPCIKFCPGQVYEKAGEHVRAANASNCLHCKTCQRKCPFNNIKWVVPESGGPRYTET